MNAVATIRQTFNFRTEDKKVLRVKAGTTFGATAKGGNVWFWIEDKSGRLHKAILPIDSELVKVTMNTKQKDK